MPRPGRMENVERKEEEEVVTPSLLLTLEKREYSSVAKELLEQVSVEELLRSMIGH